MKSRRAKLDDPLAPHGPEPAENRTPAQRAFRTSFDAIFDQRKKEADEFYDKRIDPELSEDARRVQRQAFAGLLWCKQSYHYDVRRWLRRRSTQPPPDPARVDGRNHEWTHLYNADVISMPDKWEYPWYAAWDLAFHCVAMALIDPEFRQGAADSFPARMVHAPQRAGSRLRMEFPRRESAGARLGGVARL